ncbi:phytanoyl-CoA dioxygenase family protein [Streptomyces sp. NPDC093109]|uniref:phytanoyl-CoA dioxygenase family protein n=1 Tax=Streptomyces sp. NPDC093109 TaxID=3154977 RepID=UPI00344CB410
MEVETGGTSADNGPLGLPGFRALRAWAPDETVFGWVTELIDTYGPSRTEVVRNPHHSEEWARSAVVSPSLLDAVAELLGPNLAVENTFLLIKWPGADFEVPWHQDGINDRIELDPLRSVAVWLALTEATETSGCLRIVPGSQRAGYLPYKAEDANGAARGRALGVQPPEGVVGLPVPAAMGDGVLMDTRTVHCSGPNAGTSPRIGLNIRFVAPGGFAIRDGSSPSLLPVAGTGW